MIPTFRFNFFLDRNINKKNFTCCILKIHFSFWLDRNQIEKKKFIRDWLDLVVFKQKTVGLPSFLICTIKHLY